jgi:general secretion pathway protein D
LDVRKKGGVAAVAAGREDLEDGAMGNATAWGSGNRRRRRRSVGAVWLAVGVLASAVLGQAQEPRARSEADRIRTAIEGQGKVAFSCDQMDVRTFVKMVGGHIGRTFVVDDNVEGRITVVSPLVGRQDAFPLFVSILESVGCSVVRDGELYRIVALNRRAIPLAPVVAPGDVAPESGVVTRVFLLKNIGADEVRRALETRVAGGKAGSVVALRETNHVIVTDTVDNLGKIERILDEIDRPGLARITEVVTLRFARAEELARQLNLAMEESESRAARLRRRLPSAPGSGATEDSGPVVVPAPQANSLILVGAPTHIASLKELIGKMDVDAPSTHGRLNALFLKYIAAEEAAKSIGALLARSAGKETGGADRAIAIEASIESNALLVDASPGDFDVVRRLVEQLDRAPEQVMIGVVIAEQSFVDDLTFGVEMVALDKPSGGKTTVVQGSSLLRGGADSLMNVVQQGLFPRGITVGLARGVGTDAEGHPILGYPGILNLEAVEGSGGFKIRSETALETQNNREASVSIVNEIPILKSTIAGGSGSARDVIQNIERMDVGIKLSLTPQIVPGGEVRMTLNTGIEAVIDPGPAGQFSPTIAKREVQTTVTVPDGQVIVIAGLTREDETRSVKRVPYLGAIPLLGRLFSRTVESKEKTNLLILVTPRIVRDERTAARVVEEWRGKTGLEAPNPEP